MPEQDSAERRTTPHWMSVGRATLVLSVLLAGTLGYRWLVSDGGRQTPAAGLPLDHPQPARTEEALAGMVAEKTAELGLAPKTASTPADRALEASSAIDRDDFAKARSIAEEVQSQSHLEGWGFYPFDEFMSALVRGDDPRLLAGLNKWLQQDPTSAIAYLMRSQYYRHAAWDARGSEVSWMVPDGLMQRFQENLGLSAADAAKSIRLEPKIPWGYRELLATATGDGDSPDVEQFFQAGIKAFPAYYPLYKERLRVLAPKWGGSIDAMYDFVTRYAASTPRTSPLRLLYLDLYVQLLDSAAFECRSLEGEDRALCVKRGFERISRAALEPGMQSALDLYKVSDPNQFSRAVWPLLSSMSCGKCIGLPSAGAGVLQMAASIMGSDNQIMDEPTHNSYMLDDITARVWAGSGNPANAEKKFLEALYDAEHTSFRDPAQKAQVEADIFDHMAAVADDDNQFIDIIVYEDAANAVGGVNHGDTPYRKCYAYYRLKHFKEAVKECDALIEGNGNYMQTHYWLAKAYEGLKQWDPSIAEFTPVADSADNWFRVGAALDMSFDYGQKGDFAGQLASMERYPYLFDSRMQPPHDLAVAFNNRCFALMKLGRLQDALNDCTQSLGYDRIPDALHKQQELLKLLGKKASAPGSDDASRPHVLRPAGAATTS
jgi:tetratricopeptide (TPR) repeat protein